MNKLLYRIIFALIFLGAGIYRLLNPNESFHEMEMLGLPNYPAYLIIGFEILCGIFLLLGKKLNLVYLSLASFLTIALLWGLISNFTMIIDTSTQLFIFNTTATDMMLHLMYLIVIIIILKKQK